MKNAISFFSLYILWGIVPILSIIPGKLEFGEHFTKVTRELYIEIVKVVMFQDAQI